VLVERLLARPVFVGRREHCIERRPGRLRQLIERLDRRAELLRGLCDPECGSPGGTRARVRHQCRDLLRSVGQGFCHRLGPPRQDRELVNVEDSG
jgi:hypothetical protein